MSTTAELKQELTGYAPQVRQIFALFAKVAAKEPVPLELSAAVRAATGKGYVRWSSRAGRLMFTPEGQRFYKSMRRFG